MADNVNLIPYFLYSVLTRKIITLSGLNVPKHQTRFNNLEAFSSVPTSPDCVFFMPQGMNHGRLIPLLIPGRRVIMVRVWFTWKGVFIVFVIGDYWHPSISLPKSGGRLSHLKTHSKGVTVISHLKPEGLKCNLTETIIL